MFTNYTNFRDLARKPKEVINEVKKSKKAKVVINRNKEPQAVIINLEDYEQLEQSKAKQATLGLLKLALDNKKALKSLPANLRKRANEILYSK